MAGPNLVSCLRESEPQSFTIQNCMWIKVETSLLRNHNQQWILDIEEIFEDPVVPKTTIQRK